MRISDWSSNVCYTVLTAQPRIRNCLPSRLSRQCPRTGERSNADLQEQMLSGYLPSRPEAAHRNKRPHALKDTRLPIYVDRKCFVSGQSVSVRIDLVGRRILHTQKKPLTKTSTA